MVNEFTEADHRTIVGILTSFIRKQGRNAGRLLIDDSNSRLSGTDRVQKEKDYIDKIEALTIKASGKDYFMEHLGTYISYICEAAATHHVMMNQAFVSAALAIKIQEGIALGKSCICVCKGSGRLDSCITHSLAGFLLVLQRSIPRLKSGKLQILSFCGPSSSEGC